MKLIDERTPDGSRRFTQLPRITVWGEVRDHVFLLDGSRVINYVGDWGAYAWLDFSFRGHRFLIKNYDGHLELFVSDPQCPDLILYQVGRHFEQLQETTKDDKPQ